MMTIAGQPSGAQVQAAQQDAARAVREAQQAAQDARELANALKSQNVPNEFPGPPGAPPSPPGAPEVVVVDGSAQGVQATGGTPLKIVINGKSYLLDRAAGGDAITVQQAKKEFGEDGAAKILENVIPLTGMIFGCITLWVFSDGIFKYFNKPFGVRHWFEKVLGYPDNHELYHNSVVILLDPDRILLRLFTRDFSHSSKLW
ncbi:MAG: hypothetical protein MUF00_18225 [Gemmatimonadaceae bacterium]|nr:hypothetical protein [Gemmatimonadaceae bacterium]